MNDTPRKDHRRSATSPTSAPHRGRAPRGGGLEAKASRALEALSQIAEEIAAREQVAIPTSFTIRVDLTPRAAEAWRAESRSWLAALRVALEATRPPELSWREGRVYCFQCAAVDCAHAQPPNPQAVFAGYSGTGKPSWVSFLGLCTALRPPDLDALFEAQPGVLALNQRASDLTSDLLPGFGQGSLVYRVLGQVIVGLIHERLDDPESPRGAWTIQAVEVRRRDGPMQIKLNLIGVERLDLIDVAAKGAPRGHIEQLRRTIQQAERRLATLGRKAAVEHTTPFDLEEGARPILNRLRGDLIRLFNPREDRTAHAKARHMDGARPTSEAVEDARRASDEALLLDAQRQTRVVLGRRGRAHIFTPEGRHVTSLRLGPGELSRKLAQGRWCALEGEALSAFKAALKLKAPGDLRGAPRQAVSARTVSEAPTGRKP
ncbi:hypothetical protein KKB55_21625 [Myxococcota bacterium]|nr:hypothetical protein [Myxococcota bacterium]MBU1900351.1 hypothetical protein [Myxococcota bacterium]